MALKDPTAWMEDLSVHMDDEELAGTAKEMEPTLVLGNRKWTTAGWVALVGTVAAVLGGVTVSPAIRSSAPMFIGYLVAAAIVLRGFRPLTVKALGRPAAWQASVAFFWCSILGFFAVLGGRRESSVWAYVLSVGMALFVGLINGSFSPGVIRREDVWVMVSFLLAPLTAALATYWLRHTPGAADSLAGAATTGALAGGLYILVLGLLIGSLWNEAHGLSRMAVLYLHNDNFAPKAVAYLDRALALSPGDPTLYNLRGIAYSKMGDAERAAADWNKVAELSPKDSEPFINLGADFLRRGDADQAIAALQKAIAVNPRDPKAYSNLGTAYERKGEFDLAIAQYDRAIALNGKYANAYSNRSFSYYRKGEHERALADSDRALALDGSWGMAHVNRGHALAGLGRPDEAAQSYRAALEASSDPKVREEASTGLEALGPAYSDVDDDD